jgi:hypothetical protein
VINVALHLITLKRFCFERGHIVKSTAKGDYGKLGTFPSRPYDEFLWPETAVPLPIPDWSSFRQIWKRCCPKIKIRNICEDTCPECYVLKNKFRFLGRGQNHDEASSASSSSSSDDSDKENNNDYYRDEKLIAEATEHAEQAQQQRALAQARQLTAMEEAGYPHENRRFVVAFFLFCIPTQVN